MLGLALLEFIVQQEQTIFERFSQYHQISPSCTVFLTPNTTEVPHWNVVYPNKLPYTYSENETKNADELFNNENVYGHLISTDKEQHEQSNEVSEYFYLNSNSNSSTHPDDSDDVQLLSDSNIDQFTNAVSDAFNFDSVTRKTFNKKMKLFASIKGNKFYVFGKNGKIAGTLSSFESEKGLKFLFNMSVALEFRGQGISSKLLEKVVKKNPGKYVIYSHNPIMRNVIIPRAGFKSVGTLYFVPINPKNRLTETEYRPNRD